MKKPSCSNTWINNIVFYIQTKSKQYLKKHEHITKKQLDCKHVIIDCKYKISNCKYKIFNCQDKILDCKNQTKNKNMIISE